jgi:multiple sugar transport system ATP-binding protein
MRDGTIEQIGTPHDVYHRPHNRFVAEFIGEPAINLIAGRIADGGTLWTEAHGHLQSGRRWRHDGPVLLAVRPHDVLVKRAADPATVPALVTDTEHLGSEQIVHLAYGNQPLSAVVPRRFGRVGETLHVAFDVTKVHLIDAVGGRVIDASEQVAVDVDSSLVAP